MSAYIEQYLDEAGKIVAALNPEDIDKMVATIAGIKKDGGRLFFVGVGGGAGNANHAVNDF
ncbi:MAG: hypothetical protein K9K66_16250, partial [Desulfarculaceae bacterium]|nr:hypothetical protein [Desulfarculaceae bacterium]MCF8073356.1 hypothetical protein [Desulfarculaceae bacterium]MCF8103208.1 hypothetical protein [Desulfarculaceae bacterium]